MKQPIAVIYLHRAGNARHLLLRFLRSLDRNPPGMPFHFYMIQKGYSANYVLPEIERWNRAKTPRITPVSLPDEIGFDIHAYLTLAATIEEPLCLFFNSYCQILHPNWLLHYLNAYEQLGPGSVVGATGNWAPTRGNKTYPNPHVRSNAFLIERELFLQFEPPAREKQACIEFEAGSNGMTRKVLARGGKAGIVDRFGRVYLPEEFPDSRTLRSYSQENLLVSDNVTIPYQIAGVRFRRRLAKGWWRGGNVVTAQPFSERYRAARDWETGGRSIPWRFVLSLITHPRRFLY